MAKLHQITRQKGAVAWMAGNSVASNLLMFVLLLGGLFMGSRVKQEVFPAFDAGIVNVSVAYPGASPEEVERGIVLAVEEAVQGLDGVEEIRSTANEGSAIVSVEAVEGTDLQTLAREVESEIGRITSFPEEAEEPRVSVASRKREVISYVVYGRQPDGILREKAEELRDLLLQDSDITQVTLEGVRDYEIHVAVPQENLRRYGLTLADVAALIRAASVELPGGSLDTEGGEILVRMRERKELAREYAQVPVITEKDGARLLLGDIAEISEGFSDSNVKAMFMGQPAVEVEVYRVGDQKPIQVADAAKRTVAEFSQGLPEGVSCELRRDLSDIFQQRADLLLKNGYMGLALVFICLALFLEVRLAFWVSMGIPISILGSFLVLPMADFSLNMVSMFAFIITLGIVVDDAIVVGENIFHHRREGEPYLAAAIRGAKEIALPVTFSILTNMIAFLPLFFVPGTLGKIFRMIPVVVVTVFAISLVESLLVLPAHLGHGKERSDGWFSRRQQRFSKGFTLFVERFYGPFLSATLRHRYVTLAFGAAILAITAGYVTSGRMGMTLFPKVESDYAFASATLPYGSADARATAVQQLLVTAAEKVIAENGGELLSRGIYARINENAVSARVMLTKPDVRPMGTAAFTRAWRDAAGEIPGLESLVFQSDRGGPGSGSSLTVELSHRNIETLSAAGRDLAEELSLFPSVKDIDDGSARGKTQFDFTMTKEGEVLGFNARDVALQVRHAFYGAEALRLQRGRSEVKVLVRLPESERSSEHALSALMLRTGQGAEAPLRHVVAMERGRAYTEIERRAGRRKLAVTGDVTPRAQTGQVIDALKTGFLPKLTKRYPGLTASFEGKQADMRKSVGSLLQGFLMALAGIYALLAIPFRSFFQPLIIMICIPFGIVGVVIGHMLMGYSLSVMSIFGLVALSGVVVNDSLILIDFANRRRGRGADALAAIHASGIHRFRPIMLTTITTFGGLSPMIFETSRQARFLIPMALSLGFGIVFATLITLVLVPALYMMFEDVADLLREAPAAEENLQAPVPVPAGQVVRPERETLGVIRR